MNNEKLMLARLLTGAVVFAAGMVLENIFAVHEYIILTVFVLGFLLLGADVVFRAIVNILKGQVFNENFLMSAATIGAFAIGETAEAVAVMLFYQIGELFQERAIRNSKKSIVQLMNIRPEYANLLENGIAVKTDPESVSPGNLILVKPGEKIPLDGVVIGGGSFIDTSALTGESVPKKVETDSEVLSGCINLDGVLTIRVTKAFGESAVSKIINLVENAANKKAKTEKFITIFAKYYTPIVCAFALLLAVIPPLFLGADWQSWINRGLIFLVISCPCALVISIPMSYFAGIGMAARKDILIKGGNFLDAFNRLQTIVFDKTGTLTKGVFKVTDIIPAEGFTENELLELAAHAEVYSSHPIAVSVINEFNERNENREIDLKTITEYKEHSGLGISAVFNCRKLLAGNFDLLRNNGVMAVKTQAAGTVVYAAVDGIFAGCIVISDEIKDESLTAINAVRDRNVKKTIMLSGDDSAVTASIAAKLDIDEAHGNLLPQDKVRKLQDILGQKSKGAVVAFAGDGINDAPVLAMADIGIAMGGTGTDAAIEAADVVLMKGDPSKIAEAIDIARYTKKIVWQNIVFILTVKLVFLSLGAFGFASMWEAVFADVGVSVLAILNSMRILSNLGQNRQK